MISQIDSLFSLAITCEKLLTSWIVHDYGQVMSQRTINQARLQLNPTFRGTAALRMDDYLGITSVLALLITYGGAG